MNSPEGVPSSEVEAGRADDSKECPDSVRDTLDAILDQVEDDRPQQEQSFDVPIIEEPFQEPTGASNGPRVRFRSSISESSSVKTQESGSDGVTGDGKVFDWPELKPGIVVESYQSSTNESSESGSRNGDFDWSGPKPGLVAALGVVENRFSSPERLGTITEIPRLADLPDNQSTPPLISPKQKWRGESEKPLKELRATNRSSANFSKKDPNKLNRTGRRYHSLTSLEKKGKLWSKFYCEDDDNVKKVLEVVKEDQNIVTDPADNKKRRSVVVKRAAGEKFGFTIQSYTFVKSGFGLEHLTYVDYVELNSPGFMAGLRAGDVILAINGSEVRNQSHEDLVQYVAGCREMRMVVMFENWVQKVDLCSRSIKLKKLLSDKELELKYLTLQEDRITSGLGPLKAEEALAALQPSSRRSSLSSLSFPNDWRLGSLQSLESVARSEDEGPVSPSPSQDSDPRPPPSSSTETNSSSPSSVNSHPQDPSPPSPAPGPDIEITRL